MKYSVLFPIGLLMWAGTALPAAIAYVGNTGDNSVHVVDIATNAQSGTVSGANFNYPSSIAVTPDALKAYVANNTANNVSVVNASTDAVIGFVSDPMALFNSPFSISITPDGTKAYVADIGNNSIVVVNTLMDTATGVVANSVLAFTDPYQVAITPDGTKAYVVNKSSVGYVNIVDVSSNIITGTVIDSGGTFVNSIAAAITPDGTKAYVINQDGTGGGGSIGFGSISIINVGTNTVTGYVTNGLNLLDLPQCIAISPDGSKAYVGNFGSGLVTVLNVATNTVTANIDLALGTQNPQTIAFSPDGTKAFVADGSGGAVYAITVATDAVTPVVGMFPGAYSVATFSRNNTAPVANPLSASTVQFTPVTLTLTGTDADGNALTFSIITAPSHGVLTSLISTGSFSAQTTYTPVSAYQGLDSFTFKVNDGFADSAPSQVVISVSELSFGDDFTSRLIQKYQPRVAAVG